MGRADVLRSDNATFEDLADLIEALLPIRASVTNTSARTITLATYLQIPGTETAINVREGDSLLIGYDIQYSHSAGSGLSAIARVDNANIAGPAFDTCFQSSNLGSTIARGQTFIYEGATPGVHTIDVIAATPAPTAHIVASHVWAIAFAVDS